MHKLKNQFCRLKVIKKESLVFYLVMLCCYLLEACSFLMKDKKGVDLDVRVWGRSERRVGNCKQDILYEKESIFSKKKKTKNF